MAVVVSGILCRPVTRVDAVKLVGSRKVWNLEEVTQAIAVKFDDLRAFWVEAEIDDIRRAGGQVYFTLRGAHEVAASMRAVVFDRIAPRPRAGGMVHAHGRIEFYRQRARVSMRVEVMELAGEGLLRARIDELRRTLAAEGLLRAGEGRPLPVVPRRVAVVTSPEGAARDDFLRNAWARFPELDVLVVGTPVQGDGAPRMIARAVFAAGRAPGVDVVVITRGGGSLEDLMAFNSEAVCRAVAACPVPVVSAVGHERDMTLCDEVADMRVSTPTAAAVAVAPNVEALTVALDDAAAAIGRGLARAEREGRERLATAGNGLSRGLTSAARAAGQRLERSQAALASAMARMAVEAAVGVDGRRDRLARAVERIEEGAAGRLEAAQGLLRTLSPERTVARGYAIIRRADGDVVAGVEGVRAGDRVEVQMRDGRIGARVEEVR